MPAGVQGYFGAENPAFVEDMIAFPDASKCVRVMPSVIIQVLLRRRPGQNREITIAPIRIQENPIPPKNRLVKKIKRPV